MKQLLLLICLVAGMAAGAQKVDIPKGDNIENYVIKSGEIEWVKKYPSTLSFAEVGINVKTSGLMEKPDIEEPVIYGTLLPFFIDVKKVKYRDLTPAMLGFKYNGYALIKKDSTGYTVTVKKIKSVMEQGITFMGVDMKNTTYELEDFAVDKKGGYKFGFKGKIAFTIDFTLNNMFEPLFK